MSVSALVVLSRFKFKPHRIRADSSTCISRLVRGALCRYANSARLTGFHRTKNSLNEKKACVFTDVCVHVCTYLCMCAKQKKAVGAIPSRMTKNP